MRSEYGCIATPCKFSSEIGIGILSIGGNSVDAAIASTLSLCITKPHATGLGGEIVALYRGSSTDSIRCVLGHGERIDFQGDYAVRSKTLGVATVLEPTFVEGLKVLSRKGNFSISQIILYIKQFCWKNWKPIFDNHVKKWLFRINGSLKSGQEYLEIIERLFIHNDEKSRNYYISTILKAFDEQFSANKSRLNFRGEFYSHCLNNYDVRPVYCSSKSRVSAVAPVSLEINNHVVYLPPWPMPGEFFKRKFFSLFEEQLFGIDEYDFAMKFQIDSTVGNSTVQVSCCDSVGGIASVMTSLSYPFGSGEVMEDRLYSLNNRGIGNYLKGFSANNILEPPHTLLPCIVTSKNYTVALGVTGGRYQPVGLGCILYKKITSSSLDLFSIYRSYIENNCFYTENRTLYRKLTNKCEKVALENEVGNVQYCEVSLDTNTFSVFSDSRGV